MRREYKQLMIDRENMLEADKESTFIQAWENMLLREKGESLAEAKEKERLELMEEKRRKRAAKVFHVTSSDFWFPHDRLTNIADLIIFIPYLLFMYTCFDYINF